MTTQDTSSDRYIGFQLSLAAQSAQPLPGSSNNSSPSLRTEPRSTGASYIDRYTIQLPPFMKGAVTRIGLIPFLVTAPFPTFRRVSPDHSPHGLCTGTTYISFGLTPAGFRFHLGDDPPSAGVSPAYILSSSFSPDSRINPPFSEYPVSQSVAKSSHSQLLYVTALTFI